MIAPGNGRYRSSLLFCWALAAAAPPEAALAVPTRAIAEADADPLKRPAPFTIACVNYNYLGVLVGVCGCYCSWCL